MQKYPRLVTYKGRFDHLKYHCFIIRSLLGRIKGVCVCVCEQACLCMRTRVFVCFSKVSPFLAHMSQRLIGELIVYPSSSVCWSLLTIISKIFSKTACPIKAKFNVECPWVGIMKALSRHLGHLTKMAATPIYSKKPSKIYFSETKERITTKLGI